MLKTLILLICAPWCSILLMLILGQVIAFFKHSADVSETCEARPLWCLGLALLQEATAVLVWIYSRWIFKLWTYGRVQPREPFDKHKPLLVLVHGFLDTPFTWWSVKRFLKKNGFKQFLEINLEPSRAAIDTLADLVHQQVVQAQHLGAVFYVGHSMGGLVAAASALKHPGPTITACISLGSPWSGTFWARFARGENAREMRPQSPFLNHLRQSVLAQDKIPYYCLLARFDGVVTPWTSARLYDSSDPRAEARQSVHESAGHAGLLYAPSVYKRLLAIFASFELSF